MAIEELYPYAIMTYSAFVTILAVYLWKLTNLNVDGTRHNIEKQVAAAVSDIRKQLDEKLDEFEMPDIDIAPVLAKLDAFETSIPDTISTHIDMHLKAAKATESKAIMAALSEAGMDFDAAGDEAKAMLEAQLPPEMIAMKKLLTAKVPKKIKDNHPEWAWFIETSRNAGGQYIMQRMQEKLGGGVAVENVSAGSGFGVR